MGVDVGLDVLAVDWHFEEVEGQDEEEGCGDPVEAHHDEESLLVFPESNRALPNVPEALRTLLTKHQFPRKILLHRENYYCLFMVAYLSVASITTTTAITTKFF